MQRKRCIEAGKCDDAARAAALMEVTGAPGGNVGDAVLFAAGVLAMLISQFKRSEHGLHKLAASYTGQLLHACKQRNSTRKQPDRFLVITSLLFTTMALHALLPEFWCYGLAWISLTATSVLHHSSRWYTFGIPDL